MSECVICKAEYEAKRSTSRYCSAKCKQTSYRNQDSVTPLSVTPEPVTVSSVTPAEVPTTLTRPAKRVTGVLTKERQLSRKGFNE